MLPPGNVSVFTLLTNTDAKAIYVAIGVREHKASGVLAGDYNTVTPTWPLFICRVLLPFAIKTDSRPLPPCSIRR